MKKKIPKIFFVIIILTMLTVVFSLAFFTYNRLGNHNNTIKTGFISFKYSEGSQNISLTDILPISDEMGKTQDDYFEFTISSNTTKEVMIPYYITARRKGNVNSLDEIVKLYLTKVDSNNNEEEVAISTYNLLSQYENDAINVSDHIEKLLYSDIVTENSSNYQQKYRLRMWIDGNADFSDGRYNNKEFGFTVNVYSSGKVDESSLESEMFEKNKMAGLTKLYNAIEEENNDLKHLVPEYDYIQPWSLNEYTEQDFKIYVKKLKRAGYKGLILQYPIEFKTNGNDIEIVASWYDSSYYTAGSNTVYKPNVLDNLIKEIEKNNMNIYIGLPSNNEWFSDKANDVNWQNTVNNFNKDILEELYNKYHNYNSFKGWYYNFEFYINDKDYYGNWSSMLNNTLAKVNELDSSKEFMISFFVSELYSVDPARVKEDIINFINNTDFRANDILNMQDGLATSSHSVEEVNEYIKAIKEACDDSNKNISFWLNVENYKNTADGLKPAELKRYILQLNIASNYADKLASFSYSHYYDINDRDKGYRNYYTSVTGNTLTMLDSPSKGSIYEDINGDEVVVPYGFTVDSANNIINNGLVIKDRYNNEYVWVPVIGGVKDNCYNYSDSEYKTIYYTRYINNGSNCSEVIEDTLPLGVTDDSFQINKYGGFYIGRYETTYSYNSNDYRPLIQKGTMFADSFSYQYADSDIYDGYMWNNINYENAKNVAEIMSTKYNYDTTIKTGLINGRQWDTTLKWIHSNDSSYNLINDSRSIGNYSDSISPATNGNYEHDKAKPTGLNENWMYLNIYDLAGNLGEWTSELSNGKPVIRGGSYNSSGAYGLSISLVADSFQYPHIGFRVVLYID